MSEKMKTVYSGMLAIAVIGVSAFTVSCSSGNAVNPASPSVNQTAAPPTNRPAMSSANNPPGQPANSTRVSPSNSSRSGQDSTAKIAAILGIDQQKLENALIQARSELGATRHSALPPEQCLRRQLRQRVPLCRLCQQTPPASPKTAHPKPRCQTN